jgi:hypothetical protein
VYVASANLILPSPLTTNRVCMSIFLKERPLPSPPPTTAPALPPETQKIRDFCGLLSPYMSVCGSLIRGSGPTLFNFAMDGI